MKKDDIITVEEDNNNISTKEIPDVSVEKDGTTLLMRFYMNLGKLGDDNDKDEQMLQDAIAKYGKLIQCYDEALPLLKSNRAENP